MPQRERRMKYLQKEEVERFFSRIRDKRDRALFAVIYYYGLRVSEAALLKAQDIDFQRRRIYIHRVKEGIRIRPLIRASGWAPPHRSPS